MNYEPDNLDKKKHQFSREFDETESSYSGYPSKCISEVEKYESGGLLTSGSTGEDSFYFQTFPCDFNIFREVNLDVFNIPNDKVRRTTSQFLNTFQRIFILNRTRIEASGYLPPLKIRCIDDESVLIEWIFKDFRIGFSIELVVSESSWYLVSNDNLGEVSAGGDLNLPDVDSLLSKLLSFVLSNV
jgi:hypothetical protein